jgi:hypothetical protein
MGLDGAGWRSYDIRVRKYWEFVVWGGVNFSNHEFQ